MARAASRINASTLLVSQVPLFVLSRLLSSLWVSRTGRASDWCVLQEALYKCIDTIQYNATTNTTTTNTTTTTQTFSQAELKALIRDLDVPKILAELLRSRMKSKNLLAPGMSFSWYRNREEEFACYFQQLIPLYIAQILWKQLNELYAHFYHWFPEELQLHD